jgi:NAD(P)-dependent dehydrogenase (short-subunit alcohol dehydrogenase family)
VAKAARDLGAPDVLVVPADVTKVDDAKRAVEETVAHFGKRTYLITIYNTILLFASFPSIPVQLHVVRRD